MPTPLALFEGLGGSCLPSPRGPYRWEIRFRGLFSVVILVKRARLASRRYCRSSAAFAYSSAASLPSTHLCAGIHRIVIEQPLH